MTYLIVVSEAITGAHPECASQEENQQKRATKQPAHQAPLDRLINGAVVGRYCRGLIISPRWFHERHND